MCVSSARRAEQQEIRDEEVRMRGRHCRANPRVFLQSDIITPHTQRLSSFTMSASHICSKTLAVVRSAGWPEPSHVGTARGATGARRLGRKLLAERAELGGPAGPRRLRVVSEAGVPGGAGLDCPGVGIASPVAVWGDVQAEWVGGAI